MDTYRALSERIKKSSDIDTLETLEFKVTRHYINGTIGASHLRDLDAMIQLRIAKLA